MNESSQTVKRPNLYWMNLKVSLNQPYAMFVAAIFILQLPLVFLDVSYEQSFFNTIIFSYLAGVVMSRTQLYILMKPISFCLPALRRPTVGIICWTGIVVSGLMVLAIFCGSEKPEEISNSVFTINRFAIWILAVSCYFTSVNNFITIAIADERERKIRTTFDGFFMVLLFAIAFPTKTFHSFLPWMIPVATIYSAYSWQRIHSPDTIRRLASSQLQSFSYEGLAKLKQGSEKLTFLGRSNLFEEIATGAMRKFPGNGTVRLAIGYIYTMLLRLPLLYVTLVVFIVLLCISFILTSKGSVDAKNTLVFPSAVACLMIISVTDFPLFHPELLVAGRKQQFRAALLSTSVVTAILSVYFFTLLVLLKAVCPIFVNIAEHYSMTGANMLSTPSLSNWILVPILMPLGLILDYLPKSYRRFIIVVGSMFLAGFIAYAAVSKNAAVVNLSWPIIATVSVALWLFWIWLIWRRPFKFESDIRNTRHEIVMVCTILISILVASGISYHAKPRGKFDHRVPSASRSEKDHEETTSVAPD